MADFIGCEYIKKTVTEVFMKRIRITVAYDGTDYCGWQIQPNGITVEEVLNRELSRLLGEKIRIIGASRTDSGDADPAGAHLLCAESAASGGYRDRPVGGGACGLASEIPELRQDL